MEARRRLASGEAFKGTAWGGKDGMPRISSGDLQTAQVAAGRISARF